MSAVVSRYFGKLPKAAYDVAPLDEAMQGAISYGYYEPPTAAKPTGIYKYNGGGLDTRSQLSSGDSETSLLQVTEWVAFVMRELGMEPA